MNEIENEIVALQKGFNSYEDMCSQGIRIGNGMDKDAAREKTAKKPKEPER